jgi:hypothetical protein
MTERVDHVVPVLSIIDEVLGETAEPVLAPVVPIGHTATAGEVEPEWPPEAA